MKYVYPACFYPEEDGRYAVEFPDLNVATFGDNLADAIEMAADAAAGRLFYLLKDGMPLPVPSDAKAVVPDNDTGFVSLVCADLDALKSNDDETPVKKTLTIPSWINQAAERKNINFSQTLKTALLEKLAQ